VAGSVHEGLEALWGSVLSISSSVADPVGITPGDKVFGGPVNFHEDYSKK
jgi:hypothetical protein